MKVIQAEILQQLVNDARASPRLRMNLNLHASLDDGTQRLCNAFEPNTYVRPHRHPEAGRWELFVILKGAADVLTFAPDGTVLERVSLSEHGPAYIVEIPPLTWHTLISLQSGTVLFEVKQGPYQALTDKDFASWAPQENTDAAQQLLAWFKTGKIGQRAPVLA